MPSLLWPRSLEMTKRLKLLVESLFPVLLTLVKSSGLRSLSSLGKEKSCTSLSVISPHPASRPGLLVGAYGDGKALPALCPSPLYDRPSGLCGHPDQKPVGAESPFIARLKCPFRHGLSFSLYYFVYLASGKRGFVTLVKPLFRHRESLDVKLILKDLAGFRPCLRPPASRNGSEPHGHDYIGVVLALFREYYPGAQRVLEDYPHLVLCEDLKSFYEIARVEGYVYLVLVIVYIDLFRSLTYVGA